MSKVMKQEKTEEVKKPESAASKTENIFDFSLSARVARQLSLLLIALVQLDCNRE